VYIGPVNPAEGVHKVHVLVSQTLDGIPEILFRGKQKSAGQKQSHRDLRVQRENGIVDAHRLELQIFGERLNCCVHFGVFNLITWGLKHLFLGDCKFQSFCEFQIIPKARGILTVVMYYWRLFPSGVEAG